MLGWIRTSECAKERSGQHEDQSELEVAAERGEPNTTVGDDLTVFHSPTDVLSAIEETASKLAVWQLSSNPLRELIDHAEYERFQAIVRVMRLDGHAEVGILEEVNLHWQEVVGLLLHWCAFFRRGGPHRWTASRPSVLAPAVRLASDYIHAERLLWKEKFFGYAFSADQRVITMRAPVGDSRELLDRLVNAQTWADSREKGALQKHALHESLQGPLTSLVEYAARYNLSSEDERRRAKEAMVDVAEREVSDILLSHAQPRTTRYLLPDDEVDGNRVRDLLNVHAVLEALANAREQVALAMVFLPLHTLKFNVRFLTDLIHRKFPGTSEASARRCLAFLTFDHVRLHRFDPKRPHSDYGLWPLVANDGGLILPHALLLGIDFERLLLRHAARNPATSVNITHRMDRPDILEDAIRRAVLTPLLSASNVPMVGPQGDARGDLDLVVLDPPNQTGLIVEIAGGIRPASMHEYYAFETSVLSRKVQRQIPRLRRAFSDPTTQVHLPSGWPDCRGARWQWAIAGPAYLGLPPGNLGDLIELSADLLDVLAPLPSLQLLTSFLLGLDLGRGVSQQRLVLGGFTFVVDYPDPQKGRL